MNNILAVLADESHYPDHRLTQEKLEKAHNYPIAVDQYQKPVYENGTLKKIIFFKMFTRKGERVQPLLPCY